MVSDRIPSLTNAVAAEGGLTSQAASHTATTSPIQGDDPALPLNAARRGPDLYLHPNRPGPSPSADRDPNDAMLAALGRSPNAICTATHAQLSDRDFILRVARERPEGLRGLHDRYLTDRSLVKELVQLGGELLEYMPEKFQNDPEICRLAVANAPYAIQYAGPERRADPELALLAVRNEGYMITEVDEALRDNPTIGRAVVERNPWCLEHLGPSLRADPELVRAATARNYEAVAYAAPVLMRDLDFVAELCEQHPLTLEILAELPPEDTCLEQLTNARPDLVRACQSLSERATKLGIERPGCLGSLTILETVLTNREHPNRVDERPLAVVVVGRSDHNRGFYFENYGDLASRCRLLFFEATTETDLSHALEEATTAERAELLLLEGHGRQEQLALGAEDPARHSKGPTDEELLIDSSDLPELLARHAGTVVAEGGNIVLKSCSSGQGREVRKNVANLVAAVFPQAHVWAPTRPTNNRVQLDGEGRFEGPGFLCGDLFTYHVPPGQ